jgi:hypothetical protein
MQSLICALEAQGLTENQIQTLFLTIHQWLNTHYPVMAQISKQAMAEELGIEELRMPSYTFIEHDAA